VNIRPYIWFPALLAGLFGCGSAEKEPAKHDIATSIGPLDSSLSAQPEAPACMTFDRFTTDDGLCSNTIIRVFQDSRGFIWLGSSEGLNRYDGYTFRKFQHEVNNPNSLLENTVLHICEDSKGHIWALCTTGLSEIDPTLGNITTYSDSLLKNRIDTYLHGMVVDRHDVLWINGKAIAFDIEKKKFVAPILPIDLSFQYAINARKEVFGTATVQRKAADSLEYIHSFIAKQLPDNPLQLAILRDTVARDWYFAGNTIFMDSERYLTTGNQFGKVQKYDLEERMFSEADPRVGTIKGAHITAESRVLWLAGWRGLGRFDLTKPPETGTRVYVQNERDPRSLPVKNVLAVLEDRAGNVWVCTLGGGLCRYSPSRNKIEQYGYFFPDTAGLPGSSVEALCFDRYDRLWGGTDKGLCRLDDRREAVFKTFRQPRRPGITGNFDALKAICEDPATDRLYLGYWGMPLNYFDMQQERHVPLPIKSGSGKHWIESYNLFIACVKRSADGLIFYSDFGHFLHRYDPASRKLTSFCPGEEMNDSDLRSLGFDHLTYSVWPETPTSIWLGISGKTGLLKLDLSKGSMFGKRLDETALCTPPDTGTLTCFDPDENDPNKLHGSSANCFLEDRQKRLWIGTNAGLHLVKDREQGVFECFATKAGFPNANIQALLEDERGRLWASTYDGICCFDPETKHVTAHYDTDDGLQGRQFNLNAAAKNSRGLMAFGGPNGFNLFHPDSIFQNARVPTVELTGFVVNGISHPTPNRGVALSHLDKNIAFEFSVMDFSNPARNRYQYYLEGYDTGWCAPTPAREVRYTNLTPGAYTFRVRGCNADDLWSRTELVFPVTILAPWWATWWSRTLLALLALGFVVLLIRRREARLRQKLEEDERTIRYLQVQTLQAQMNPHFIFNVLGVMQHQIIKSRPQEANRQLGNLSTLIRRFLDSSVSSAPMGKGLSQNDIPLEEEIELLTMYAEFEVLQRQEKFEDKGFAIEVDESVNMSTVRIPPMIIQPYIENAVKHGIRYLPEGRKGFVRIRFAQTDNTLCCTVEDNGVGREEAARIQAQSHSIYKSHGTRLVKERTEILNHIGYDIDIETNDRPGGGTIVTITIKD